RPVCAAVKPLAIMLCADRVPIVSAHFKSAMTQTGSPGPRIDLVCITSSCPRQFLQNFKTPSSLPGLTSLNRSGFDATSLWHFDAAEQAPSTASLAAQMIGTIQRPMSALPAKTDKLRSASISPLCANSAMPVKNGLGRSQSVAIEYRAPDNHLDRLPALVADLIAISVTVEIGSAWSAP